MNETHNRQRQCVRWSPKLSCVDISQITLGSDVHLYIAGNLSGDIILWSMSLYKLVRHKRLLSVFANGRYTREEIDQPFCHGRVNIV